MHNNLQSNQDKFELITNHINQNRQVDGPIQDEEVPEIPLLAAAAIQNRPAVSVVDHSGLEDVAIARDENPEEEEETNLDLNEIELEDQRMTEFINNFSEITT